VGGNLSDYLASSDAVESHFCPSDRANEEELLLIETNISRLLGEFSRYKPGAPEYTALDYEYRQLLVRKDELKNGR